MSWEQSSYFPLFGTHDRRSSLDPFGLNEWCFIRKEHKCGKIFGASKSCFIACPTEDDLEPILGLMSEKLTKVGIEPIVAVKERAYGQDIFCTKICGKIVESRFCIVILDDTISEGKKVPNPNVYYEYGLMTSLRKHIVPLQKDGLELAFNIQSYDTIKYNTRNIGTELDRAIKDAIRTTEAKEQKKGTTSLTDKTILRRLEMADIQPKDEDWFLANVIDDTHFKGFGHHEKNFYVYLGKIDETSEFQDYLEDLGVVLHRTERKIGDLNAKLEDNNRRRTEIAEQMKAAEVSGRRVVISNYERELMRLEESIRKDESKLSLVDTFYIGFIINPQLEPSAFIAQVEQLISHYDRYRLTCNANDEILFGDICISVGISNY